MAEDFEGLVRDKTRKPSKPPLPVATVQRVVDLALGPLPGETTTGSAHGSMRKPRPTSGAPKGPPGRE